MMSSDQEYNLYKYGLGISMEESIVRGCEVLGDLMQSESDPLLLTFDTNRFYLLDEHGKKLFKSDSVVELIRRLGRR